MFGCVRSYLTPVRDEESESQRKARSRQARQSRRSTQVSRSYPVIKISDVDPSNADGRADFIALFHQGVTLTDLQEAEKTIGRGRPTKTREEEKEEREKQDKEKQEERKETETKEEDYRSKYRSFEEVRLSTPLLFPPDTSKASSSPLCSSPIPTLSATGLCLRRPPRLLPFPQPALPPPRPTPAAPCPPAP